MLGESSSEELFTRGRVNLAPRSLAPVVLALALLLAACGERTQPLIEEFTASPTSLPAGGGDVTLSWRVNGAPSLTLAPDIGPVTGNSVLVQTTQTRTYTLTATGSGRTESASVTVTVAPGGVDRVPPTVTSVFPQDGATGVSGDVVLLVEFSEPMARAATEAAYRSGSAGLQPANVDFSWNDDSTILRVAPAQPLAYATGTDPAATAPLTFTFGLSGATDLAGNALADQEFDFATLRRIAATAVGDPAQDGAVDGATVSNGVLDLTVTSTSRGLVGFNLTGLPADLDPASIVGATLLVNGQSPCLATASTVQVEHVAYGATLTAAAATTTPLRELGFLSPAPMVDCWNAADAGAAVTDDWSNRGSRGGRSQYRLSCAACTMTFFAGEAAESLGDANTKMPRLVVEYLVP